MKESTTSKYYVSRQVNDNAEKPSICVNNNAVVIASGILRQERYVKMEHIIARFNQITNSQYNTHLFLLGSRDGINWAILNHSKMQDVPKNLGGQEMRRHFSSARFFQIVFVRTEKVVLPDRKQNTTNRLDSYFERFSFDYSLNDNENKLR
jgi:hypothetical protein